MEKEGLTGLKKKKTRSNNLRSFGGRIIGQP